MAETDKSRLQGYNGTDWRDVRVDKATDSLQTIEYEHHEIHAGSHYYVAETLELGSGSVTTFAVQTPNTTQWTHMVFNLTSAFDMTMKIFEDSSANMSSGSATTAFNSNRNSSNSTTLVIRQNPTITTTGTQIYIYRSGGSVVRNNAGSISRENELVLKQNTTYLFQITSNAASNAIGYLADWYEHTDKQ